MRVLTLTLALLLSVTAAAPACYGPKLYLGVGEGARQELLAALVMLYVKEKTGTEVVAVPLQGAAPAAQIAAEQVDMALAKEPFDSPYLTLPLGNLGVLLVGPRPRQELQFTTVVPALRRLEQLAGRLELAPLVQQVAAGGAPLALMRQLLMAEGAI